MKESAAYIASAAITIFLTGSIIIAHELSKDFRQLLASLTGNHWISVSLIAVILFVLCLGFLLVLETARKFLRVDNARLWSTALIAVTLIMIIGILAVLSAQFLTD